jgi:hypothetical protein
MSKVEWKVHLVCPWHECLAAPADEVMGPSHQIERRIRNAHRNGQKRDEVPDP